jgi:hypothetical protein
MNPDEFSIARLAPGDLGLLEPLWNALREHHAAVMPQLGPPRPREDHDQPRVHGHTKSGGPITDRDSRSLRPKPKLATTSRR